MINQELPDSKIEQEVVINNIEQENAITDVQEELNETYVDVEKQNEEQIKSVLTGILEQESAFDKTLEGSTLLELTLLMEVIANHDNIKLNSTRVGVLKRTFDENYQQELQKIKNEIEADPEQAKKHKQIFETYSNRFTVALAKFNKRRNEYEKQLELEKQSNTQKKKELLDKLIQIVNEDRFEAIDEVRAIQAAWKAIGNVVVDDAENLFGKYKAYLDQFYDKRSVFNELKEQDHQTHLKEKQFLIDCIIELTPNDDQIKEKDGIFWKEASEKVKIYQEEWKIIGNVPIEYKDIINNRFKEVVDNFYNQRKKYYEIQDSQRLINAELKKDILNQIKPYTEFFSENIKDWTQKTEEFKELQAKWKMIGPAPSNEDAQLWDTFKQYSNAFYNNKSKFYQQLEKQRQIVLNQKIELCEKAEEILNANDFKNGFLKIKELQKKWKEINNIPHADFYKVLRRFKKACDNFFKKRDEFLAEKKKQEEENTAIKKAIIARILELANAENLSEASNEVKELQEKWKSIGLVSFKSKEALNKEYRDACDLFYQKLKSKPRNYSTKASSKSNKPNYSSKDSSSNTHHDVAKKLRAKIARLEVEIEQYENNIEFFAKGKAADKIKTEYSAKIEAAKSQKKELEQKLKALYEKKENPTSPSQNQDNKD